MCYNELINKLHNLDYDEILNRLGNEGVNSYMMNNFDNCIIKERVNVDNVEDFDINNNHITLVTIIEDDGSKNYYVMLKKSKLSDKIPSYLILSFYLYGIHDNRIYSIEINDTDDILYIK